MESSRFERSAPNTNVYCWEITPIKRSILKGCTYSIMLTFAYYAGTFLVLWLISLAAPRVAYWISLASFTGIIGIPGIYIMYRKYHKFFLSAVEEDMNSKYDEFVYEGNKLMGLLVLSDTAVPALTMGYVGAMVFALASPLSHLAGGFSGTTSDFMSWHLFALENFLDVLTLTTFQLLEIRLSDIEPVTRVAQLISILINLFAASALLTCIFGKAATYFREELFYGTWTELYWKYDGYNNSKVRMIGKVSDTEGVTFRIKDMKLDEYDNPRVDY